MLNGFAPRFIRNGSPDNAYVLQVLDANLNVHAWGGANEGAYIRLHADGSSPPQNSRFEVQCVD